MNLYEVTNGFSGDAHVRSYAWAQDEAQALDLAQQQYIKDTFPHYGKAYSKNLRVRLLFNGDEQPFATIPDDAGFERGD